jgi:hypothetical protein
VPKSVVVPAGAAPDTSVGTPSGNELLASLRVGDLVYSVDAGHVVAVPILRTSFWRVREQRIVRVTLASGAVLSVSPRHPMADGRLFSDLRSGDRLDGVEIVDIRLVAYQRVGTHDILPHSDSAAYFANGALIGSSLATAAERVLKPTVPLSAYSGGLARLTASTK